MTKYAASQIVFAVAITVVGALKGYQILVNYIADKASDWTGLT